MERLEFARQLRSQQTDAEQKLWQHLRAKLLQGLRFRRQKPMVASIWKAAKEAFPD